MHDYTPYLQPLLLGLGALQQYARAFKILPDYAILTVGGVVAFGLYFLTSDWSMWGAGKDIQWAIISLLMGGGGAIGTLYGGTFIVAKAANAAPVTAQAHIMVPATDSK